MLYQLRNLNSREQDIVLNAPIWVTLLIACSDETINRAEIEKSREVMKIRTFAIQNDVSALYKEINEGFDAKVQAQINALPLDGHERVKKLIEHLEGLNKIFPKLEKTYSIQLYNSLLNLASAVARADGGLFGIGAVSDEEADYVKLPMLQKP